jgi:hypothetical protein
VSVVVAAFARTFWPLMHRPDDWQDEVRLAPPLIPCAHVWLKHGLAMLDLPG